MRANRFLWFLPLRTILLLAAQCLVWLLFKFQGEALPWAMAGRWWSVWGSIADVGCLIVLIMLTRKEHLTLWQLFKAPTGKFWWNTLLTFCIVMPFTALGSILGSWITYGTWHATLAPGILYGRHLPVWAIFYSFFIWAPVWSVTEEMTYNGYLLTRLTQPGRPTWMALLGVCFWWALQHSFLPFIPDRQYLIWRFVSFVPCVLALALVYLKTKNLLALTIAHLLLDWMAVASTISY